MEFPRALIATATVTSLPRSPDVMAPTCRTPLEATTFSGAWTVVTPVSSMFHTSDAVNWCLMYTVWRLEKKTPTVCWLKLVALATLVACGFLIDSEPCLFRKPVNQSFPAILAWFHASGNLQLNCWAHWNASFRTYKANTKKGKRLHIYIWKKLFSKMQYDPCNCLLHKLILIFWTFAIRLMFWFVLTQ